MVSQPTRELPLGPALEFMRRLAQLNHAFEQVSRQMATTIGITAPQRMLVRCIGKYPGITAGSLAEQLHLDPGTVSAALGRLERKRLVARSRDQRDKRRVTLGLTATGRALDQQAERTVESAIDKLLATTDRGALDATMEVLRTLAHLMAAEVASSAPE